MINVITGGCTASVLASLFALPALKSSVTEIETDCWRRGRHATESSWRRAAKVASPEERKKDDVPFQDTANDFKACHCVHFQRREAHAGVHEQQHDTFDLPTVTRVATSAQTPDSIGRDPSLEHMVTTF